MQFVFYTIFFPVHGIFSKAICQVVYLSFSTSVEYFRRSFKMKSAHNHYQFFACDLFCSISLALTHAFKQDEAETLENR